MASGETSSRSSQRKREKEKEKEGTFDHPASKTRAPEDCTHEGSVWWGDEWNIGGTLS